MSDNPLNDLCEAIRALPPMTAVNAINELLRAGAINFNDGMEYQRALATRREFVK